jgi:hypothetical protein
MNIDVLVSSLVQNIKLVYFALVLYTKSYFRTGGSLRESFVSFGFKFSVVAPVKELLSAQITMGDSQHQKHNNLAELTRSWQRSAVPHLTFLLP